MKYDTIVPNNYSELRKKNIDTLGSYFDLEGDGYLNAYKLYQDQAWTGVHTTSKGIPEGVGGGIENIKAWYKYNVKYFKNLKNTEVTIFQKDDPNKFIVTSRSEVIIDVPAYDKTHYKGFFFHEFEMRDGKIQVHWIRFNVMHLYNAMRIPIPTPKDFE